MTGDDRREAIFDFVCKLPYLATALLIAILLICAAVGFASSSTNTSASLVSNDSALASAGLAAPVNSTFDVMRSSTTATGRGLLRVGGAFGAAGVNIGHGVGLVSMGVVHAPGHVVSFTASTFNVAHIIRPSERIAVPVITPIASASTLPDTALAAAKIAATPPAIAQVAAAPLNPFIGSVAPASIASTLHQSSSYALGNCTWWVAARRTQIGHPIPQFWGNAANWAWRAAREGYVVNHQPTPGAIMQTPNSAGGLGHVAFVEAVDADGTWHISEMNVLGYGLVDTKALPASAAASYNFIHDPQ